MAACDANLIKQPQLHRAHIFRPNACGTQVNCLLRPVPTDETKFSHIFFPDCLCQLNEWYRAEEIHREQKKRRTERAISKTPSIFMRAIKITVRLRRQMNIYSLIRKEKNSKNCNEKKNPSPEIVEIQKNHNCFELRVRKPSLCIFWGGKNYVHK